MKTLSQPRGSTDSTVNIAIIAHDHMIIFQNCSQHESHPVLSHFHLGFRVISSEHITDITRLILKDSAELQHCSDTTWGRGLVDHDVGLQNIAISGAIYQKEFVPFL